MPSFGQTPTVAPMRRGSRRPALGPLLACLAIACGSTSTPPSDAGAGEDVRPRQKDTGFFPDAGTEDAADGSDAAGADVEPQDAGVGPPDFGPPPPDTDNDGIPNDEDPAPSIPNPLLFGDGFDSEQSDWLFTSAQMKIETGLSVLRMQDAEPFVRVGWLGPRPNWIDVLIRTRLRVIGVGNASDLGSGRVGILGRTATVVPNRYMFCSLDLRNGTVVLSEHDGNNTGGVLESAAVSVAQDEWVQMSLKAEGRFYDCTIKGVTVRGQSGLYISGSAGIRTWDVSFEADDFSVYDL